MKRKYYYFLTAAIIIGGCFLAKSQWDKQNTESTERIRFETTKEEDKTVRFIKDNIARTTDFWLYVLSDSCPKYREPNLIIYKGEIECQNCKNRLLQMGQNIPIFKLKIIIFIIIIF